MVPLSSPHIHIFPSIRAPKALQKLILVPPYAKAYAVTKSASTRIRRLRNILIELGSLLLPILRGSYQKGSSLVLKMLK